MIGPPRLGTADHHLRRAGTLLVLAGVLVMAAGFAYLQWRIYSLFYVSRQQGVISTISTTEEAAYSMMAIGALLAAVGWFIAYWRSSGAGLPSSPQESIGETRVSAVIGLVGFALLGLSMAAYAGTILAGSAVNGPSRFPAWTGPALLSIGALAASLVVVGWAWERGSRSSW